MNSPMSSASALLATFHVFHLAGGVGTDNTNTDPIAPSNIKRDQLLSECERAKHVLNGAPCLLQYDYAWRTGCICRGLLRMMLHVPLVLLIVVHD